MNRINLMRNSFTGYFRPTKEEFDSLWANSIFAIDANVLLNLYRYSPKTRSDLEKTLESIEEKLFIPNHAAKEYLKNRLSVISSQASTYDSQINSLRDIFSKLSNGKKHPFLPENSLDNARKLVDSVTAELEEQREILSEQIANDEILNFVETLFKGKTGEKFSESKLEEIAKEGEMRFSKLIPPGYKDEKKNSPEDPFKKYGDLIIWKQLIEKAQFEKKSLVFVTDDKKEDWWLVQSGKTVSPRPELVEEFIDKSAQKFWMYTVDKFVELIIERNKIDIDQGVIEEIIEVSDKENSSLKIVDCYPLPGQKIATSDIRKIFVKFNNPIDRSTAMYIGNMYIQANMFAQWNTCGWIQFAENDTKLIWHVNDDWLKNEQLHGPLEIDYQRFEIHLGREPPEWRLKDVQGNVLPLTFIPVHIKKNEENEPEKD